MRSYGIGEQVDQLTLAVAVFTEVADVKQQFVTSRYGFGCINEVNTDSRFCQLTRYVVDFAHGRDQPFARLIFIVDLSRQKDRNIVGRRNGSTR